ncbi:hypothetical protein Tco_1034810, partial [Tanacetum coccineum]
MTLTKGDKPAKKKQSASKSKGLTVLSEVALTKAQQMKIAIERSNIQTHSSHASGSGDGVDIESKVPDGQQQNISGTNEGAGDKLEVPNVPEYRSESEEESWTYNQGEDDEDNDEHDSENNNDDEDGDQENVSGEIKSNNDEDDFVLPNLSTYKADDQEEEKEEEKANDDEDVSFDQMTEEVHVTLTTEPLVVQQQSSSVSSDLVSKFINPSPDTVFSTTETPSFDTTIPQPLIPIIQPQQQTHDSTTTSFLEIPNFVSHMRRRSGKEESSKEATQKESKSTSSSKVASRSQPKSSGKSAQAKEHGPRVDDLEEPLHQEFNTRNDDISPVREIIAVDERLWNPSGSQTPNHEWNKTNTNARGHQVIPFDHFINNDLEYLKGGSLSQKYTTSLTKTKFLEVYGVWHKLSTTSMPTREHITRDQNVRDSMGDFKRLRHQDIEDMLLLLVQERVEDLQLVIKSYQKKINLSRPDSYRSDLRKMTPYTTYHDIQGIIYQDEVDRNRLMCMDELHKFSNGTLNHVCTALNDIATGIQMEYLTKRKWSKQDNQRARVMINVIDKKLKDGRLMRSQEKFVGGRPYGGDLRLLQRTICFYHMMFLSL